MKEQFRSYLDTAYVSTEFDSHFSEKLHRQLSIEIENLVVLTLIDQYYKQHGDNFFKFLEKNDTSLLRSQAPHLADILSRLTTEIKNGVQFAVHGGGNKQTLSLIGDLHTFKSMRYQSEDKIIFKKISYYDTFLNKLLEYFPHLKNCFPQHTTYEDFYHREFIEVQTQTDTEEAIRDFYTNLGEVFGLVLAFKGIDVYVENILTRMPYPVFFDLECLFSAEFNQHNDEKARYSLESTGLLVIDHVYDISAFTGGTKPVKSYLKPFLVGTEEKPSIIWSAPTPATYSNIPSLAGTKVNPLDYKVFVQQGLKKTLKTLLKFREDLKGIVKDTEIGTRTIVTPTRIYRAALQSYAFPQVNSTLTPEDHFIQELSTRKILFDVAPTSLLVANEVESLKSWLIPKYYSEIHSPEIRTENGMVVAKYNKTQYDSWVAHFGNLETVFGQALKEFTVAYP